MNAYFFPFDTFMITSRECQSVLIVCSTVVSIYFYIFESKMYYRIASGCAVKHPMDRCFAVFVCWTCDCVSICRHVNISSRNHHHHRNIAVLAAFQRRRPLDRRFRFFCLPLQMVRSATRGRFMRMRLDNCIFIRIMTQYNRCVGIGFAGNVCTQNRPGYVAFLSAISWPVWAPTPVKHIESGVVA